MNYSELKSSIALWMHRGDLTSQIDTFIDLFEARANRALRVPEMETRTTFTPTSEYTSLPTDFLELRNIQINTSPPTLLEYASPQKIDAMGLTTGTPRYYSIVGNQFQINPSASGRVVEIAYYRKITPLDNTNTSNFLIESHPDYYLMGCIYEAAIYALDPRASQVSQVVAEKELAIIRQGKNKQHGSGPIVVSAI